MDGANGARESVHRVHEFGHWQGPWLTTPGMLIILFPATDTRVKRQH